MAIGNKDGDIFGEGIILPPRSILGTRKLRWENLPKVTRLKSRGLGPEPSLSDCEAHGRHFMGFWLSLCCLV